MSYEGGFDDIYGGLGSSGMTALSIFSSDSLHMAVHVVIVLLMIHTFWQKPTKWMAFGPVCAFFLSLLVISGNMVNKFMVSRAPPAVGGIDFY